MWRFRAVVNAVRFIMLYKTHTISRVKAKLRMLSILRFGPRRTLIQISSTTSLDKPRLQQQRESSG